jgi:hypothetical protein
MINLVILKVKCLGQFSLLSLYPLLCLPAGRLILPSRGGGVRWGGVFRISWQTLQASPYSL